MNEYEILFWNAFSIFKSHWFYEKSIFYFKKQISCKINKKVKRINIINEDNLLNFVSINAKYIILSSKMFTYTYEKKNNQLIHKQQNKIKTLENILDCSKIYLNKNTLVEFCGQILKLTFCNKIFYGYIENTYNFYKYDDQNIYFRNNNNIIIFGTYLKKFYAYNCYDVIPYKYYFYTIDHKNNIKKNKILFCEYSKKNILFPVVRNTYVISSSKEKIIFIRKISINSFLTINYQGVIYFWLQLKKKKEFKLDHISQLVYEDKNIDNIVMITYDNNIYTIYTENKKIYLNFYISKCNTCFCIDNIYNFSYDFDTFNFNFTQLNRDIFLYCFNNKIYFLTVSEINSKTIYVNNHKYYIIDLIDNVSYYKLLSYKVNYIIFIGFENGEFNIINKLLNDE